MNKRILILIVLGVLWSTLVLGGGSEVVQTSGFETSDAEWELVFSSYLGGDEGTYPWETGRAIVADSQGNSYIAGVCYGNDFPVYSAWDDSHNGEADVFVGKFKVDGTPEFITYFGGGGIDNCWDIAIDDDKNIYITGSSSSADLPGTTGKYQEALGLTGARNAFLAKFDSDGDLDYCTYLGGENGDRADALTLLENGEILLSGQTQSDSFPIVNGFDSTKSGQGDFFIAKMSNDGTSLLWSTLIGGSGLEGGCHIDYDTDYMYLAGHTDSTDYPVTDASTFSGGTTDVVVTKFNTTHLVWAKYLDGSDYEECWDLDLDNDGDLVFTGFTDSDDFTTATAYNSTFGGQRDIFLTKISPAGTILWSTYIGGENYEEGRDLCIDSSNNYNIAGYSSSQTFPILDSYQVRTSTSQEAVIVRMSEEGDMLMSSYLGGSSSDYGYAISVVGSKIFLTGETLGYGFPTEDAYQEDHAEGVNMDAFISFLTYGEDSTTTTSTTTETSTSETETTTNNTTPTDSLPIDQNTLMIVGAGAGIGIVAIVIVLVARRR